MTPARRGDAATLATLLGELGYPGAAESSTVHWVLSHPEIEVLVARDNRSRAVGMLSLSYRPQLRMNGRLCTFDELVVTKEWRRQGVGRALIDHAVQRMRSLSVKRIQLTTHEGWDEGVVDFLKACGFEVVELSVLRYGTADFQNP